MSQTGYPYEAALEVAFRDIDAFGHVNNAVFFSYMEYVRVKYVKRLFTGTSLESDNLLDIPLILVKATCSYSSPALLNETISLGIGLSRFGNKSFELIYRFLGEDGRLIAEGQTIQVMFNYKTNSAFQIPNEIKARVKELQGDWQPPYP